MVATHNLQSARKNRLTQTRKPHQTVKFLGRFTPSIRRCIIMHDEKTTHSCFRPEELYPAPAHLHNPSLPIENREISDHRRQSKMTTTELKPPLPRHRRPTALKRVVEVRRQVPVPVLAQVGRHEVGDRAILLFPRHQKCKSKQREFSLPQCSLQELEAAARIIVVECDQQMNS